MGPLENSDYTYSNANVLDLLGGERVARVRTETLHPGVGDTIGEDDQRLDKLCGDVLDNRRTVPRPAKLREGAQKARERDQAIAPEDAAL